MHAVEEAEGGAEGVEVGVEGAEAEDWAVVEVVEEGVPVGVAAPVALLVLLALSEREGVTDKVAPVALPATLCETPALLEEEGVAVLAAEALALALTVPVLCALVVAVEVGVPGAEKVRDSKEALEDTEGLPVLWAVGRAVREMEVEVLVLGAWGDAVVNAVPLGLLEALGLPLPPALTLGLPLWVLLPVAMSVPAGDCVPWGERVPQGVAVAGGAVGVGVGVLAPCVAVAGAVGRGDNVARAVLRAVVEDVKEG